MSDNVTGYRKRLNEVHFRTQRLDYTQEEFEKTMTEWMQADYPGNYTLREVYLPDRMCWGAKIIFETEADELWFKLKYE